MHHLYVACIVCIVCNNMCIVCIAWEWLMVRTKVFVCVCVVMYLSNKSDSEAGEKGKEGEDRERRLNQLERTAEWNIWLTSSFWIHFAVVSGEETECLLVPYIYRSSEADGDVQKRGDRARGRVKELVTVRASGRRRVVDLPFILKCSTAHTPQMIAMQKPVSNEHTQTHTADCSVQWRRTQLGTSLSPNGSRLHCLPGAVCGFDVHSLWETERGEINK